MTTCLRAFLPLAGLLVLLSGCSNAPKLAEEQPPNSVPPVVQPMPSSVQSQTADARAMPIQNLTPAHLDPKNPIFTDRSIYFAYDEFSVKKDYFATLERHAKYLISKPSLTLKIEGNADERGGAEYNLALGQKRAEAVVKAMRFYGVKDAQIEAVSFGKEKPKASGHDEAAWTLNRRVDLSYLGK